MRLVKCIIPLLVLCQTVAAQTNNPLEEIETTNVGDMIGSSYPRARHQIYIPTPTYHFPKKEKLIKHEKIIQIDIDTVYYEYNSRGILEYLASSKYTFDYVNEYNENGKLSNKYFWTDSVLTLIKTHTYDKNGNELSETNYTSGRKSPSGHYIEPRKYSCTTEWLNNYNYVLKEYNNDNKQLYEYHVRLNKNKDITSVISFESKDSLKIIFIEEAKYEIDGKITECITKFPEAHGDSLVVESSVYLYENDRLVKEKSSYQSSDKEETRTWVKIYKYQPKGGGQINETIKINDTVFEQSVTIINSNGDIEYFARNTNPYKDKSRNPVMDKWNYKYEYDKYGNWIEKIEQEDNHKPKKATRTLTYFE